MPKSDRNLRYFQIVYHGPKGSWKGIKFAETSRDRARAQFNTLVYERPDREIAAAKTPGKGPCARMIKEVFNPTLVEL